MREKQWREPDYDELEAKRTDPANGHPVADVYPYVEDWLERTRVRFVERGEETAALSARLGRAVGDVADQYGCFAETHTIGGTVEALEDVVGVIEQLVLIEDPTWVFVPRRWSTYVGECDKVIVYPEQGHEVYDHPIVKALLTHVLLWLETAAARYPDRVTRLDDVSERIQQAVGWMGDDEDRFAWILAKADAVTVLKELVAIMRELAPWIAHPERAH